MGFASDKEVKTILGFGPAPAPASIVRKITHAEPSLVIVEDQQGDLGTETTTRKYTTDGKEISLARSTSRRPRQSWTSTVVFERQ